MTEISSQLKTPSGAPVRRASVTAKLVASASWLDDASGRVVTEVTVRPNSSGLWAMDLTPTDDYEVADAHYRITEIADDSSVSHLCAVPRVGPVRLRDILISGPVSSGFIPVSALDDLSDVSVDGAVIGDSLVFNGSLWVPDEVSGGSGPAGIPPSLVDAKGDLIVATAPDTVSRFPAGVNGQVLTPDSSTVSGLRWQTLLDSVYPLSGYGAHSASCLGESATVQSSFSSWHNRIWIPAGNSITKIGMVITTPGILGSGGLNAFVVFSDDGSVLLGQTSDDDNFWTVGGLRFIPMQVSVPETFGRFVRVLPNVDGYSQAPSVAYSVPTDSSGATVNGLGSLQRRSAYRGSYVGSFPSSINPDTLGTPTNFIPYVVVG